jgi:hypothetical protein
VGIGLRRYQVTLSRLVLMTIFFRSDLPAGFSAQVAEKVLGGVLAAARALETMSVT